MQVVVMRVRYEHRINRWQVFNQHPRSPDALDDAVPHCPIGIDQNIRPTDLDQKRRVTNPRDPDLPRL